MDVQRFIVNPLAVNCYLVFQGGQAIIVDPGEESQEVLDFAQAKQLEIIAIVNTHGHADHIAGNGWFRKQTGAPLWIHKDDAPYLQDAALNLSSYLRQNIPREKADRFLKEGDLIPIGGASLQVLHTPGHSPGSISLWGEGILLSGDTLFKSSIGRFDLPGGDEAIIRESVLRLGRLPLETKVYPGHGEPTTIAREIKDNPFL